MIRRCLAVLPFVLWSLPAMAEPWHCQFTAECTASGGCTEAAYSAQVIAADHEGQLFLTTLTGDSPVTRLTGRGDVPASYASAGQDGLAELLTIEADGTALMTLHIFDTTAQAATYFGTCEVLN